MPFLRWLGGFIILFWLIGVLFSIGGGLINILLIIAAVVFVIDAITSRKKTM
jgi:4-hydroxybenzoate polyprenyltransferase